MTPIRIQRQRIKDWRMPPNTVYVGRPTIFGNPYGGSKGDPTIVKNYRDWLVEGYLYGMSHIPFLCCRDKPECQKEKKCMRREEILKCLPVLRGKNLACWCPLDQLCHADVLLELANAE